MCHSNKKDGRALHTVVGNVQHIDLAWQKGVARPVRFGSFSLEPFRHRKKRTEKGGTGLPTPSWTIGSWRKTHHHAQECPFQQPIGAIYIYLEGRSTRRATFGIWAAQQDVSSVDKSPVPWMGHWSAQPPCAHGLPLQCKACHSERLRMMQKAACNASIAGADAQFH